MGGKPRERPSIGASHGSSVPDTARPLTAALGAALICQRPVPHPSPSLHEGITKGAGRFDGHVKGRLPGARLSSARWATSGLRFSSAMRTSGPGLGHSSHRAAGSHASVHGREGMARQGDARVTCVVLSGCGMWALTSLSRDAKAAGQDACKRRGQRCCP
jgi:hypothetical protein